MELDDHFNQIKMLLAMFIHQLGVFSEKVCEFISKRNYENKDSKRLAMVTSFTNNDPVGLVQLNDFVFGANPRYWLP